MKSSRWQSSGHVLLASLVLGLVLIGLFLWVVCSYGSLTPEEQAKLRYEELMAEEVFTIGDLADVWACEAWSYIEVAIPGATCWTQTKGPLPFDPTGFPKDFLDNLIGYLEGESEVPVYEVTIYQDRLNRDICFLNSDYKLIYVMECPYGDDCNADAFALERFPDLYSGRYTEKEIEEIVAHLDPARVLLRVQMIPSDRLYDSLLDQAKGGGGGDEKEEGEGEGEGAKTGGGSNDLWVGIEGPAAGLTNIEISAHLPDGFTNRIEIFTCTNLLDFWWTLAATNLSAEDTNVIYWTYDPWANESPVFFALGNADVDSDADGIVDAREKFVYHTDPGQWDTDGDGFSDGDEINTYGTDPLDKYSVPAPEMLSVSGKYLVDGSTNPVVLKSVNIGAWLQWEQFMLKFEPWVWTNVWGSVITNDMDEATAREMLQANVDYSVILFATNYSSASGVETQTWCGGIPAVIGNFGNGEWLCFAATDFGPGVSNVAIALAVDDAWDEENIEIRLGSPTGTLVGTLTARDTGGWCDLSEQSTALGTPISGTQAVYFVGNSDHGDIANLYRFRFYNDGNTRDLFGIFRDNYFTTNDLDRIRDLGYNCIRLPFFHHVLEDETNPYTYLTSGWDRLDWVLDECRKRHLWVILDLHSTPGGQNAYQASGFRDPFRNRLWHSSYYQDRTAALWVEIANRYATNPVVAGYDLFNEPVPYTKGTWTSAQAFSNNILPMLERLYTAIRSNDTSHVLFMESNLMYTNMWASKDYLWWPDPAAKGWTNVCYQFHVYDRTVYGRTGSDEDSWFTTQKGICDTMIRSFTELRETRSVPIYVGEYAPWNEQNFDYWTRQLQANEFHWGHWNYRSWGWDNPDKPEEGKTLWGLDYRSKDTTNAIPDLQNDALSDLQWKMAWYGYTNYTDNTHLQDVAGRHAESPELSRGKCEFYLNAFDGPDKLTLSEGWPWRKVAVLGPGEDRFRIASQRARVYLDQGCPVMRFETREEADARFEVGDATGCDFSVNVYGFDVVSQVAGPECAVNLCVVRDSVSAAVSNYDTHAVTARLAYDDNTATIDLYLYTKEGGVGTLGTEKAHVSGLAFTSTNCLELFVNATNASLSYGGVEYTNAAHGLDPDSWPNGAVCVVEAEDLASGGTMYVDLDDFQASREDAGTDALFTDAFAAYPDGIEIRAETEYASVEDYWATSRKTASFATNARAFWIPKECAPGQKYGTWMNVRRDYQNDVRLPASSTNVVEVRAAFTNFTQGIGKIAMMPEYFPTEIYNDYAGQALYVEFERDGANIEFIAYRHDGAGGNRDDRAGATNTYVGGQAVSLQADANTLQVYYGSDLIISTNHALTNMTAVFENGVYPHYEIQNDVSSTNAYVLVDDVVCRALSDFSAPEE